MSAIFHQQNAESLLHLPLIAALLGTDLLDWRNIDGAVAGALKSRKDGSLEFLERLMDLTLLNDSPLALYSDFVRSLEEAWDWIDEEPDVPGGKSFRSKILAPLADPTILSNMQELGRYRHDQMEYVFEEWVHLCNNPYASDKAVSVFVEQVHTRRVITNKEDFFIFVRLALDRSIDRFEQNVQLGGSILEGYIAVDALAKLIAVFVRLSADHQESGTRSPRALFLDSVLSLGVLVMNSHHVNRPDHFNQKVFYRFFSMLLHHISAISELLPEVDRDEILLCFADRFLDLGPVFFPGFLYSWLSLIEHRAFLPAIMRMPNDAGWAPFTKIMKQLLEYAGDALKAIELSALAKDVYRATLKTLTVLYHDFPEYLAVNQAELCESIPYHCTQFINMVLSAAPGQNMKMPDPLHPGLRVDRMDAAGREEPESADDPVGFLRRLGLLEILDQALQTGPTEDAIAHMTYAINKPGGADASVYGNVPINTNLGVINALVTYIGGQAVAREAKKGSSSSSSSSSRNGGGGG
ncbi:MAG: hypothetical protein OK454_04550, partial [Thaumarchaeota archaeon]|nr:hypothetical protein [Nitrososphaerota archaeon]